MKQLALLLNLMFTGFFFIGAVTFANAAPIHWGESTYEVVVLDSGITWWAAKDAAENGTHSSISGHLVTITSVEEQAFVSSLIADQGGTDFGQFLWLGGDFFDLSWTWITGEAWDYTNWKIGLPGDPVGAYNVLRLQHGYGWVNSRPGDATTGRYIVETGAVPLPSAIWLLGSGLIGLVGFRRKFRKS